MPDLRTVPVLTKNVGVRSRVWRQIRQCSSIVWGRWSRLAFIVCCCALVVGLLATTQPWNRTAKGAASPAHQTHATKTVPGMPAWVSNTATTQPATNTSAWGTGQIAIGPAFTSYYSAHAGSQRLGQALTPAYPSPSGLIQIFTNGAILQPLAPANGLSNPAPSGPLAIAVRAGTSSGTSNVLATPLTQALLARGSLARIAGSALTYADLRASAQPKALLPLPTAGCPNGGFYIYVSHLATGALGHCVPAATWAYLHDTTVWPDGWQMDVGQPLTEAIPTTISRDGTTSQVLIQAFWNAILVTPAPRSDTSGGTPAGVSIVPTGLDYLDTFGAPRVVAGPFRSAWLAGNEPILSSPDGSTQVILGYNYPVTLIDAQWSGSGLWYTVRYQTVAGTHVGWMHGDALMFAPPPPGVEGAPWAGFRALSPALWSYLNSQGSTVGVTVYDVTRNAFYSYNGDEPFLTGSSVKVPILVTYLDEAEEGGWSLSGDDASLLTSMIEVSDNDAAQVLYDALGDGPPIAAYLQREGITSFTPNPDGFGWSTLTPSGMVRLLILLDQGQILTPDDRAFALSLMENVEPSQQMGIGQAAPAGATYALKDGWVQGPDGTWWANSSGIVWAHGETYIISVSTGNQQSLEGAYSILNTVCAQVAQALT